MAIKKFHAAVAAVGILGLSVGAYVLQRQPASMATAAVPASSGGERQQNGAVPVEVARVEIRTLQDETQAVGTLRSRQGVMLRPEVSGRVARLGFQDGQRVKRGHLLVQLDDTLQQAQLQKAQAEASIARTNLNRNRELVSQQFVSQAAVDQSAAVLEVAQASVALAQAELVRMRIVAPFDGAVGIRVINVGDYVKDGSDLLSIDDTGAMLVDFRLPERVLSRLKVGQVVDVALDGLPGRSFKARVDAFDSQLDANGRSLLVRASLGNADGVLKPGMFARARLVFAVRDNAVVVPEEALVPVGNKRFLFKVVDGADGRKTTQRVEANVGLRVPGKVEILGGLTHADTVVTAGHARLMQNPDVAIRVVELGGSPRPAASAPAPASGPGPAAAGGSVSGARPMASLSTVRYP